MENEKYIHEVPPIKYGEVFVPEKEIQTILKSSKEERKQKLAIFKEKLTFQKVGLARVQDIMIDEIRQHPDKNKEELFETAVELGSEFGMNDEQKKNTREVLEKYENQHMAIKEIRKECKKDNDLFKELFWKEPKGKIEVSEGPVSLYFKCHDFEDYLTIFYSNQRNHRGKKRDFTEEEKSEAMECKGINIFSSSHPEIGRAIMAENDSGTGRNPKEGESPIIFTHEEQHMINSIFEKEKMLDPSNPENVRNVRQDFITAETREEKEKILIDFFRQFRINAEAFAKDEIIAHYKDGHDDMALVELTLSKEEGGGYDYLEEPKRAEYLWLKTSDEVRALTREVVEKVLVKEYRKTLADGVLAVRKMEEAGYGREEIIAILTHEPLAKWEKVVARVIKNT